MSHSVDLHSQPQHHRPTEGEPRPGGLPLGTEVMRFEPLEEGSLIRRYKRFLADVELDGGHIVVVHCPNTGPMTSVLNPGGRVRLRHALSPQRKLAWTWEQAEVTGSSGQPVWVGVNTALANRLVKRAIEAGALSPWLGSIQRIRSEVPYGVDRRSRIDLLLERGQGPVYVEVKNTTWCQGDVALFPDTVTVRGQKHLHDLMAAAKTATALLVPCVSRSDSNAFAPGDEADPTYGRLFREARKAGVEVLPCRFHFQAEAILWQGVCAVKDRQLNVL